MKEWEARALDCLMSRGRASARCGSVAPLARRLWSQYMWGSLLMLSRARLRVSVRCETVTT